MKLLGNCWMVGKGEGRSVATGHAISVQPDVNWLQRQASGPRPKGRRPEREETAVPLPVFSSYAAAIMRRPELAVRSSRRARIAKRVSRSAEE